MSSDNKIVILVQFTAIGDGVLEKREDAVKGIIENKYGKISKHRHSVAGLIHTLEIEVVAKELDKKVLQAVAKELRIGYLNINWTKGTLLENSQVVLMSIDTQFYNTVLKENPKVLTLSIAKEK